MRKFEDPNYLPPDVDVTFAFQMWQYVGEWQGVPFEDNSLVKFAKTVQRKNGVAVLSIGSRDGDLHRIRGKSIPAQYGHDDIVAERVSEELTRLGLKFQSEIISSGTYVSSCFQDGKFNPNQTGKDILSFMLRTSWDGLSPEVKQEVGDDVTQLVRINKQDELYQDRDVLLFRDAYIFIPGNQPSLAA